MRTIHKLIFFLAGMLLAQPLFSQALRGFVYDEFNQPIPYANIYFKFQGNGTVSDIGGKYFYQFTDPGVIELVITAVGYNNKSIKIIIPDKNEVVQNIWLETDIEQLNEVLVKSKKRDPAYEIIQAAIKQKDRWKKQYESSTSEVYIKAKEVISAKEKKRRKKLEDQELIEKESQKNDNPDVFSEEEGKRQKEINKIASSMNMFELQLTRHYKFPDKVKEIRSAHKKFGSTYGLFFSNTSEAEFNFYTNLMSVGVLNDQPLISPLHITSVLTYKFNLIETTFYNEQMLYKIKVTPRKKGNASWSGYIWILDKNFCIMKVDLHLSKGGLILYDGFNIKQEYGFEKDSVLILLKQDFQYESKAGNRNFSGSTKVRYSDYQINPNFDKKFFNNEIAVTTEEAYERDSSYWGSIRPEPLTRKEQKFQFVKDSIYAHTHSEVYLDSLDSVYNRITLLDLLWDGVGFSDRKNKKYWEFSSLAGTIDPFEIGGIRLGPNASVFKKWKNEKTLSAFTQVNTGIRNPELKGMFVLGFRYDPKHFGRLDFYLGDQYDLIVENDAVSNLLQRKNWVQEKDFTFGISRELINGLYGGARFRYARVIPITDLNFNPEADDWFVDNEPIEFDAYNKAVINTSLTFIPFQKYMTEPNRKIVLGSKWPRLFVYYEKGLGGLFNSDINYDYAEAEISQSFKLGTMGTSNYKLLFGKYLNTQKMYYTDYEIYPRGDQWFFASLMESMQIQDTTLTVTDQHFRVHYAHHFNGAIVNYIPFVKKLRIHAVAGASALWIKESNYHYEEVFLGIERTFKIQRSRFRFGIYFVAAESTNTNISPRIKFAVNQYSIRDQSWGY